MLISSVWRGLGRSYFVVGLLVGGALTAALISIVGAVIFQWWVPNSAREVIVAVIVVLATATSHWILQLRYAQNRRQVPEMVRNQGPRVGGFQFGFEMGTASRTFMTTTMPHILLMGLLLVVALPLSLLVGIGFGAGRALVPLLRSYNDYDMEWTDAFDRWSKITWLGTTLCGLLSLTTIGLLGWG
jgi:hypothetical protein